MSAFDGKTKIGRKVGDPITDHTLPNSRSLAWKAITTPIALKGTNGTHCELVHGDQWNEWKGNHTENIARNQTIKVVGKHKETLVESCYQNIIGPHVVQNNTVRNETRLGKFTKVYGEFDHQEDYDGHMTHKDIAIEHINVMSLTWVTTNIDLCGAHVEVVGVHGELAAVHGEAKLFHAEYKRLHLTHDDLSNDSSITKADLSVITDHIIPGIESSIKAVNERVTMMHTQDSPIEVHDVLAEFHSGAEVHIGNETHVGAAEFTAIAGFGVVVP